MGNSKSILAAAFPGSAKHLLAKQDSLLHLKLLASKF